MKIQAPMNRRTYTGTPYSRGKGDFFLRKNEEVETPVRLRSPEFEEKPDRPVICAACGAPVTHRSFASRFYGSFEHVFTNPSGYVFRIGLFTRAEGVVPAGMWIAEFSWFPETLWRFVVCSGCYVHLGWEYTSTGERGDELGGADGTDWREESGFFGLILSKLTGDL